MDSSIYGVLPLGAQMGRSESSVSGIRAPLTVDDSDFESPVSSKNSAGSSYYSGSELEDFESGEDMPEVARVVEEDEGVVEKTDLVKEFVVSDGAVVGLNGEVVEGSSSSSNKRKLVQESGNIDGNGGFRPLARYPSRRIYRGVGKFDDSDDSGSLLSDSSDDDLVEKEKFGANLGSSRPVVAVVVDDEVSEGELSPVMSIVKVPSARKLSIPIAKISGDSDDDSCGSVVSDEEGFSGVVKVPSIEVLHRINSAPKVRMLEADEGEEDVSQVANVVEMELVGEFVASEKEAMVVENSVVQDNGLDFNEETVANALALDEEFNPTSESGDNGEVIHLDEDIKEVDVIEDRKECLELVGFREPAFCAESIVLPNIASVEEAAASLGDMDCKSSDTGLEDDCIFNQNYESENVESMKQEIEQTVGFNADCEISSAHQCVDISEDASSICAVGAGQSVFEGSKLEQETGREAETSELLPSEVEESSFHSDDKAVIAEIDVVQDSATPHTGGILLDHSQEFDIQVLEDFHDEVDVYGGMSNGRRIIDSSVLAAPFEDVDDAIKVVSVDGVENLSLGSNLDDFGIFDPARCGNAARARGVNPSSTNGEALSERENENIKKIQKIRVKYLRLLDRLGRSPEDSVASKVLYQLTLAAGRSPSLEFHLDSIKNAAVEFEAQRKDNVDFPLSVMIIGKTGVGKSATVNSIFGESTAVVDAFEPATSRVKEITGLINGVKLKIFDTPGLRASLMDQSINRKILSSIKKVMEKSPPDVILYVDRLDTQRGDLNDLPLLRLVTSCLGSSMWRKSIVGFTHGTAVPPDGLNGCPLSYEAFVAQQSQVTQRLIRHSAGEPLEMNSGSVLPVCVIENHPFAEKNGRGETVLHNGESWRSQLLLLCCSMKILSEVSSVVATQSPLEYGESFGLQIRSPPLAHYLSSFQKSNVHPELSNDQSGDIVGSDVELCYSSDSGQEDDFEHDDLPPCKLLEKKQSREETRRLRSLSRAKDREGNEAYTEGADQESVALPPTFDGNEPSYRYRVLKPSPRLLTRPVLTSHGWDHDCNYDGLLIEDKISIANGFPAMISVQLAKDKKEFKIQLHPSVSAEHEDKGSIMAGLDILPLEEKLAYALKGEARIKNSREHRTAAAASITLLGGNVVTGLKVEDRFAVGKRAALVGNAGIIQSQDDAAYVVNFDLCRNGNDQSTNQDDTSLGMSVMRCRGEVIYGCSLHSGISISRKSKMDITAGLNNRLMGKICIKTSSSDQLQIAALALVPIARAVVMKIFRQSGED